MAFEWNFRELMRPRLADAYARRTYETLPEQLINPMPTQMDPQGQGWLAAQQARNAQSMQGYIPNDAKLGYGQDYEDRAQSIAGEVGQDYYGNAGGDRGATAAQIVPEKIKELQSNIEVIEKRLAENKAKLKNWSGNADKIAAIEARKINVNDPTSIWRWKQDKDYATQLAAKQNGTDNTAKANALIEVANAVDNMVVDPSMDTPTANAMLSKLADYKTMLQKNGLPTKMVDDKIAEIKGDNKKVITETSETEDDVTYEGKDREQSESKASRLLDKKNVTVQELENASKSNVSNDTKNKLLAKRDEVKAKNIQEEKDQKRENSLLGEGKFLTSEEIQFMEGRKDVKKHTDNFGNIWFTKRQL
jgi:hypothetical protein